MTLKIKSKTRILSYFVILFLLMAGSYQCAFRAHQRLTEQSQEIHEYFWNSKNFISSYLMKGTEYQTPLFHFVSDKKGPTVLIIGGTHGDEPAGFEAAHQLLKLFSETDLKKGEIYLIPEANKLAIMGNKRRIQVPKGVDIEIGNLNRCYPGKKEGYPMEQVAYQITTIIREKGIDLLLDLHESKFFHLEAKQSTSEYNGLGQTLIYTPDEEATWLGMIVIDKMNSSIPAGYKQFSMIERPIKFSAAWSAGENFKIPAFTIETTQKLQLEKRIQYHVEIVMTILKEKGII